MFKSLLITIYGLFLITYVGLIAFAQYRVYMFCKNKELEGYSRFVSIGVAVVSVLIVTITLFVMSRYQWDDRLDFWIEKVLPGISLGQGMNNG